MPEPMGCGCARGGSTHPYCHNCDLLVGLDGYHVTGVSGREGHLVVTVESPPNLMGCPACGSWPSVTAVGCTR